MTQFWPGQWPLLGTATHTRRLQRGAGPTQLHRQRQSFGEQRNAPPCTTRYNGFRINSRLAYVPATVNSVQLRNLPLAGRSFLLHHTSTANCRIYHDSKVEESFERYDRTWRRWVGYCSKVGIHNNTYLNHFSSAERELVLRGFLSAIRTTRWSVTGDVVGTRSQPVVGKTVRGAASQLATAFRRRIERSPLHAKNSKDLRPTIRDLLKAFDNVDPPPRRQKAITPSFLRALYQEAHRHHEHPVVYRHAADLIIGAYFFACRSCEYVVTPQPGVTRRLQLGNVTFRDAKHRPLQHNDPHLQTKAHYVTLCFENQKNRQRMERRTHTRTDDEILCPVRRFTSAVQRILTLVPQVDARTDLCTTIDDSLRPIKINNDFTLRFLRATCLSRGGATTFGFHPLAIGNKSLRSGAAMALFMTHHTPDKIMMMGRWKSLSFLDYIRPQVLELSHDLAQAMIRFNHFLDLTPSPDQSRLQYPDNGRPVVIPGFNVVFDLTGEITHSRRS